MRSSLLVVVILASFVSTDRAYAATCDVTACSTELAAAPGLLVNDIFRDANGGAAATAPVYGVLVNAFPGCPDRIDFGGAGHSVAPFDCPGVYVGDATAPTIASGNAFLGALDHRFWEPCRLANTSATSGCVDDWTCIADGAGGNYAPWTGLAFDLGGPSNQVVVFAENLHGPLPCTSLGYTVYFTDNPFTRDVVLDPASQGVDPMRWNRASLSRVYTAGTTMLRTPDPAGHGPSCGDTASYAVESDAFTQVFSLPCAVTLRYVAVIAGNDGRDFAACAYDGNVGAVDAVAGLIDGAFVCPDADHDGTSDCACPGAPPVCDCNDANPTLHPGAPEPCDSTLDLDCDGSVGGCDATHACAAGACRPRCDDPSVVCPRGNACTSSGGASVCTPIDCGCSPGEVCVGGTCSDACAGIVCPHAQVCRDGGCVDPCDGVSCASGLVCRDGVCARACDCFAGDVGCASGSVCDRGFTDACVVPTCASMTCGASESCVAASGACEPFCGASVACPQGQHCVDPSGCVPLCRDVACIAPAHCDPTTGECVGDDAGTIADGGAGDAGSSGDGGASDGGARDAGPSIDGGVAPAPSSSCGCRAGGSSREIGGAFAWLVVLAWSARRRRR